MLNEHDLEKRLAESLVRHRVPGVSVAVLHEGKITAASAGVANVTTGVGLTPDTLMHIGSITKVFNATLVMQLVDEGLVSLDEPVVRYVPDLRLKDREALPHITPRMLLNHTSGIDGSVLPDYGHDEETIEKGVARFAEFGQKHAPGAEYSYCNGATVIAGYLAQRLAGKSWYELMQERIFTPLGMEHAATLPEDALLHRTSVGHYLDPQSGTLNRTSRAFYPLSFAPAGASLMMSAKDLIVFAGAHLELGRARNGTRIVSADSAALMQRPAVINKGKGYGVGLDIGIGWMVTSDGLVTHGGSGRGFIAGLYVYPRRNWAAAIITNAMHGLKLIHELIAPWLEELGAQKLPEMEQVRLPAGRPEMDARKYVGVYEDFAMRWFVGEERDGLTLARQAKVPFNQAVSTDVVQVGRLLPLAKDQFLLQAPRNEDDVPDAWRVYAFRNPDGSGRMRHLGAGVILYPKVL
jgi:CubicO group peptidase (beta-lactamase class C family)